MALNTKRPATVSSAPMQLIHANNQSNKKPRVATIAPKVRIYSGGIQQIIEASRTIPNSEFILYETVAKIISIKPGRFHCERIILLRSVDDTGPIIQGVFNEIDLSLSIGCRPNRIVRCMGRFINKSRFIIFKIGPTDEGFLDSITRLNTISNFAIKKP